MSWAEAIRLTRELGRDTSSHVHAALAGWTHPASREALVLMDLHDAYVNATFEKPNQCPRPWPDPNATAYGKGTAIPLDELGRILAAHRAAVEAARPRPDRNGRLHDARGRFVSNRPQSEPKVV